MGKTGEQIDREKLRAAIRRMGSDYLFLMVDAATTVLPQDSLRTLIEGFLNPDELRPNRARRNELVGGNQGVSEGEPGRALLREFRRQLQEFHHDLKRDTGLDGRLPQTARPVRRPG